MPFDVVIVGAGLVGASLAGALAGKGLEIAVVEPHPPVDRPEGWDARVYAISPGSAAFLHSCGMWPEDDARIGRVETMRVFGDDARSQLTFDAYEAGLRELAHIVESGSLQRTAWDRLAAAPGVTLFPGRRCERLDVAADGARLALDGDAVLETRLVVGADGARSWVRDAAGIGVEARPYHQMGVVANFATARPHRGVAWQWFRRDGILAWLPLPGDRMSMVWSTSEAHAAELTALGAGELAATVAAAGHDMLGALEVITPAQAFALRLARVAALVRPRVALVGDAAHNVHPLAGQGVNLGYRDARALAAVLLGRGSQTDCGDYALLRAYERARREDILATGLATDGLKHLFNNDSPLLAGLRNLGLAFTDRLAPVKRLLVQHAVA
jgi:ubiquinone biosynthesis UbiH/UbiF/VisC/COQ6 family hydroxylase